MCEELKELKEFSSVVASLGKKKTANIQMEFIEAAKKIVEDVTADFKSEELGQKTKQILTLLGKIDNHIKDKNVGLAESTIQTAIKELSSVKKRILQGAIDNLQKAIEPEKEEGVEEEDIKVPGEEEEE
jgi:hypothetical protein